MFDSPDDDLLITRARKGDMAAMEALYRMYEAPVYNLGRRILSRPEEAEEIRLENLATRSRVYRLGLYERTMFHFANWMISTGSHLRKRYEIPTTACNHPTSGSFVG